MSPLPKVHLKGLLQGWGNTGSSEKCLIQRWPQVSAEKKQPQEGKINQIWAAETISAGADGDCSVLFVHLADSGWVGHRDGSHGVPRLSTSGTRQGGANRGVAASGIAARMVISWYRWDLFGEEISPRAKHVLYTRAPRVCQHSKPCWGMALLQPDRCWDSFYNCFSKHSSASLCFSLSWPIDRILCSAES